MCLDFLSLPVCDHLLCCVLRFACIATGAIDRRFVGLLASQDFVPSARAWQQVGIKCEGKGLLWRPSVSHRTSTSEVPQARNWSNLYPGRSEIGEQYLDKAFESFLEDLERPEMKVGAPPSRPPRGPRTA
eukprot:1187420-Prorocentrum_minimum.AAC.5